MKNRGPIRFFRAVSKGGPFLPAFDRGDIFLNKQHDEVALWIACDECLGELCRFMIAIVRQRDCLLRKLRARPNHGSFAGY
jgi:hypothetical protein